MGKETTLWDDSALINAFDEAVTKYKAMHSTSYQSNPREEVQSISRTDKNESTITDGSMGNVEPDAENDYVSRTASNTCVPVDENTEVPPIQDIQLGSESLSQETETHFSSAPPVQEGFVGYSESQNAEYIQLLTQYYKLEEQRQNVLVQLHQVCGNYQSQPENSASYVPWNESCSTFQENLVTNYNPSHTSSYPSCGPYPTGSCLCAPCSVPPCVLGGQCVPTDPVKQSSHADDSLVKKAMGAAERAISSIKLKASFGSSNHGEEKVKENADVISKSDSQDACSGTDLTEVLNAWYSAGFYTGKYLVKQSIEKGRP